MKFLLITLFFLLPFSFISAQGPRGGGRGNDGAGNPRGGENHPPRNRPPHGAGRENLGGLLRGLGAKKEEFLVWRNAVYRGERFFAEGANKELKKTYHQTYKHIVSVLRIDRLEEELGREFKERLVEIGKSAAEKSEEEIRKALSDLNTDIQKAKGPRTPEEALTPVLNKHQNMFEEAIDFANEANYLSEGKANSFLNKLKKLEKREDSYKKDGKVSKNERERLHERASKIAKDLSEAIREKG